MTGKSKYMPKIAIIGKLTKTITTAPKRIQTNLIITEMNFPTPD
jgi:hypothetical protein